MILLLYLAVAALNGFFVCSILRDAWGMWQAAREIRRERLAGDIPELLVPLYVELEQRLRRLAVIGFVASGFLLLLTLSWLWFALPKEFS